MDNIKKTLKDFVLSSVNNKKSGPAYRDFKIIESEINDFRNNIQPMTDEQGNIFRHMAGAGAFSQMYSPLRANLYGLGKEFEDYFIKHKGLKDSLGDIKNNFTGSLYGVLNKDMPRSDLYRLIFEEQVK